MINFNIPEWEKNTTGDTACENLSKNATKSKKKLKPGKKARILEKLARNASHAKETLENDTVASNRRDFDGKKAKRKKNKLKNKTEASLVPNLSQNFNKNANNGFKNSNLNISTNPHPKKRKRQKSVNNVEGKLINVDSNNLTNKSEKHLSESLGNPKKKNRKKLIEVTESNSIQSNSSENLPKKQKKKRQKSIESTESKLGKVNSKNLINKINEDILTESSPLENVKKKRKKNKRQKKLQNKNDELATQETDKSNELKTSHLKAPLVKGMKTTQKTNKLKMTQETGKLNKLKMTPETNNNSNKLKPTQETNKLKTQQTSKSNKLKTTQETNKLKTQKTTKSNKLKTTLETELITSHLKAPVVKRLQSPLKRAANAKLADKLRGVLQGEPRGRTLRQRMLEKLKGAHFRILNEEMYTKEGKDAVQMFKKDPTAFDAYHDGYRQQVARWPLNPLDNVIKSITKMSKNYVIADFGCGEGRLSQSVEQKVHSFDLVAVNDGITACDMSHVPLQNNSVEVAVFCLSLMGTNLNDFLLEANRVLKVGGILKIAEVESRFDTVETFIQGVEHYGFKNTWKDFSHNLFYFLDFKKESNSKKKNKLPTISLHPCLYKKR